MNKIDMLLKSLNDVLNKRILTPSQRKLLLDYRTSLSRLKSEQELNEIVSELFGRHLERLDRDFYGERSPKYTILEADPPKDVRDRTTVEIREFLPGRSVESDIDIEPYSYLRERGQTVEL